MKILANILVILFLATAVSCVGVVEDAEPELTNFLDPNDGTFNFPGIVSAKAISHDKVEIEFFPAVGSGETQYDLYVNGSDTPLSLNLEALQDGAGGKLKYVQENLSMNQTYKFKLKAIDLVTNAKSENENEYFVTTFDNQTADFIGINEVTLIPGQASTSAKLVWVPATMNGLFVATAYDPVFYEITYITDVGGPANLNNPNYAGSDRQTLRIPDAPGLASPSNNPSEITLNNLQPDTRYYFQVRAVNKLYNDYLVDPSYDVSTIPVNREVNTKFLTIKTESSTSLFDFDVNSLVLLNPAGDKAFNNIDAFWSPGDGSYDSYRVYIKQYQGSGDALIDDELTAVKLDEMTTNTDFIVVDSDTTSLRVNSLTSYEWYQVKVVLCKTSACPLDISDPDAGIISQMRAIRTEPTLAPFSGITFIDNPTDANELDKIRVRFDPPVLSQGFADTMEFFCLDPNDYSNYTQFSATPGVQINDGSPVANCNGLTIDDTLDLSDSFIHVRNVNNTTTSSLADATYCFAMAPAIRLKPEVVTMDPNNWVVRCTSPEIKVPSIDEFPGLAGACSPNETNATVNWQAPTGGIYNKFQVYWKEFNPAQTFSFVDAVAANPAYSTSGQLTEATTSFTIANLSPGKHYEVGVLSIADDGSNTLYSEFNLNVNDCHMPIPIASFDEWTRVFAIGPKIDGRFPKQDVYKYRADAHIYEALNYDGIPHEVPVDASDIPDNSFHQVPPGNYNSGAQPSDFTTFVDAKPNENNYFMSNQGIISLAWKEVSLDFLQSQFQTNQDHGNRSLRNYGYKVLRSSDNKVSWQEVTVQSGLLHAKDFNYRVRSNSAVTTERMVFFTDYSVKYSATDNEVDRARIYYYKIVPVFDGIELAFDDSAFNPHHIVKVTLPPPNMALAHRKMVNRQRCLEIGKTIDKSEGAHYRCDYNGLGSTAKSHPWQIGETALDLGGDNLVDRFELGCSYSRGDFVNDPRVGTSIYNKSDGLLGSQWEGYDFRGTPYDAGSYQDGVAFRGCVFKGFTGWEAKNENIGGATDYPLYRKVIHGDCLGNMATSFYNSECNVANPSSGYVYNFPGAYASATTGSCNTNTNPADPSVISSPNPDPNYSRFSQEFSRNIIMQSEFLAVFYNKTSTYGFEFPDKGPNGNIRSTTYRSYNQCFINLASIGNTTRDSAYNDAWRARWVSTNSMPYIKDNGAGPANLVEKTVNEVIANTDLYDSGSFQAPASSFWNNDRFDGNTKIGRIFSSNSAKLPQIKNMHQATAQKLCNVHKVQTGFGDDSGNWLGNAAPKKKRLLRKHEVIAFSAWPQVADNNMNDNENWTHTLVTSKEANQCVNSGNAPTSGGLGVNWRLQPERFYSDNVDTPLFTGSSRFDNGATNSDNSAECTSQYGIQDLPGNLEETTSEIYSCDYSTDTLYFGQYTGNPVQGAGGLGGNPNQSVRVDLTNNDNIYIRSDAVIEFANGDPDITGNLAWAEIGTDSGYCSMVDQDSSKANNPNWFRDIAGTFNEIYNPDQTVNSNVVEFENPVDQDSVNELRNGDGFFLNFGQNNIGPELSSSTSLSFTGQGPYFSPVLGLPLSCGLSSCDIFSSDNREITTAAIDINNPKPETIIKNFHVGNSVINYTGIGAYYHYDNAQPGGEGTFTVPAGLTANPAVIIEKFIIQGDGSNMNNYTTVTKTMNDYFNDGTKGPGYTFNITRHRWNIPRNSSLIMPHGGSFAQAGAGKYTSRNTVRGVNNGLRVGMRCTVRVNEDD